MSFKIHLPLFEGPFDLLLFFIERDELDIYDIPIAKITHDFLSYIQQLKELNMEVASEFIVVAATLMRIKSKMLLPKIRPTDDDSELDPREELVQHLLEYKRYKAIVDQLAKLEEKSAQSLARGNIQQELHDVAALYPVALTLEGIDLQKLLFVFNKVMAHAVEPEQHTLVAIPYSIHSQRKVLLSLLQNEKKISFEQLIMVNPERLAIICGFLAVLDLIQAQSIKLTNGIGYNNFWVELIEE